MRKSNKKVNKIFNTILVFIISDNNFWFDRAKNISALALKFFIIFLEKFKVFIFARAIYLI